MMMTTPRVSILIPVSNREDLLRETALSALGQTARDIEVVICDNASTGGAWSMCEGLEARSHREAIFPILVG